VEQTEGHDLGDPLPTSPSEQGEGPENPLGGSVLRDHLLGGFDDGGAEGGGF
jgi:hypothetical protein